MISRLTLNIPLILLACLAVPYIFSGLICWLIFLSNRNQHSSVLGWEHLLMVLTGLVIVFFWPAWIIIDIRQMKSQDQELTLLPYITSDSDSWN